MDPAGPRYGAGRIGNQVNTCPAPGCASRPLIAMYKPNIRYLMRELSRRKGRLFTNLLAVAILVAIFIITTSVMNAYAAAVYLPFKDIGADMIVQKSAAKPSGNVTGAIQLPFGKGLFDQASVDKISGLAHVKDVSRALVVWRYDQGKFITVEGFELGSFTGDKYGSWVTSGRALNLGEQNVALVEKHFAKFYGLKPGDKLQLGASSFQVVGVVAVEDKSQVSATNVYISLTDAQALLGTPGYSQLYVRLDALSSEKAVRSEVTMVDKDAVALSSNSIAASLGNYMDIYEKYQLLVLLIIAAILALILFQVNTASLMERRRDIGILQTVGWTKRNISSQLVSEVFVQTVLGFILGLVASALTLVAIGSISVQTRLSTGLGNDLTSLSAPLQLSASAAWEFFFLTLVISIALSFFLTGKLAGMKPVDNLRKT
jgi:putative ABC transport system permease protein